MTSRRSSVRLTLLALLLAGLAFVWIAAAVATVLEVDGELEEVFDAHLAQTASLLLMRIGGREDDDEIDTEHAPRLHKYAKRLSFQVWERGTRLRLRSAGAPDTRFSETEHGFSTVTESGRAWRVFSQWDPEGKVLVQVRDAMRDRRHVIVDIVKALAKPLLFAVPLLALFVWLAAGRAFRPLARVTDEIARRDPTRLAPIEGEVPVEIAPLVERLNALLARVRVSLEGERRFASDAAHELRTPLAALRAQLQVAQGAGDEAGRGRALGQALAAAERTTRVVEQLLTLARLEHHAWRESAAAFDLHEVAREAIAGRADQAGAKRIALSLEGAAKTFATGHEGLAAIALGNLLDNAIRYSPPDSAVMVAVSREGKHACVRVRDEGPGIPKGRREAVLRRFTRLDDSGEEGSGLGLSIVSRIAELHGTPLALADAPAGRGLEATLRFPVT